MIYNKRLLEERKPILVPPALGLKARADSNALEHCSMAQSKIRTPETLLDITKAKVH